MFLIYVVNVDFLFLINMLLSLKHIVRKLYRKVNANIFNKINILKITYKTLLYVFFCHYWYA